jgi:hypothetical protein
MTTTQKRDFTFDPVQCALIDQALIAEIESLRGERGREIPAVDEVRDLVRTFRPVRLTQKQATIISDALRVLEARAVKLLGWLPLADLRGQFDAIHAMLLEPFPNSEEGGQKSQGASE